MTSTSPGSNRGWAGYVETGQHALRAGLVQQDPRCRPHDAVGLFECAHEAVTQRAVVPLEDRARGCAVGLAEVVSVAGPALSGALEEPVEDDEAAQVAHLVGGEKHRQPHERALRLAGGEQPVDTGDVFGRGVAVLVEGVVDDQAPRPGAGGEVVLGEPGRVADVAEGQVDLAPGAAPDHLVGVRAEHVGRPEVDAEKLGDESLDQLAPAAGVVLTLGLLDDGLVVDVLELDPHFWVAVVVVDVELGDLATPVAELGGDDGAFVAGDGGDDRAVVEGGEAGCGELAKCRHLRGDGG